MNSRAFTASAGLVATGLLTLASAPAQAFSFTTNYTSALSGIQQSKGDIKLDSVTLENGNVIDSFTLITSANIISNDLFEGGEDTGGASADIGKLATTGITQEELTNEGAQTVLNNLNLNNIIDTEDTGNFLLDLEFENAVDNIFIWERGMNSTVAIQALDADGNVIGNQVVLDSSTWDYAGFDIETQEINSAQQVGSTGVSAADLGLTDEYVHALRIFSEEGFNGPDFKIVGSVADVPEPSMLIGLGTLAAGALATRRRQQESA